MTLLTASTDSEKSDNPIPPEQITKRNVARNTAFQYGLQAAKYLFPFITIPYLTRVLGPDVYAIRAYILAAMTFAQVFLDYGFNAYGTRQIARNQDNLDAIRNETYAIALLRVVLCLVGALLVAAVTPFIPLMAANPVYVVIAYTCVCFKAMLPDFVFQGLEEMAIITYRFVVSQAVATVLIFVMVHGSADLLWVPTLEAFAAFIAFVWSWANVVGARRIRPMRPSRNKLASAFRASSVFFLSNAATTIFTSLTTLMIGILVEDPAQVSYWAIAMTAVQAVQSLYTPITNSLYPHMCARKDFALAKKLLIIGVPVVLLGTVAFALLSDVVMWLLGGEEYLDGSYIVAMVSPVLFFSFPAMLIGFPVLAAVGRERQLTTSSIVSSVFHIVGLVVLAAGGWFTIPAVCVLRDCTEMVLLAMRGLFVLIWVRGGRLMEPQG